MGRTLLRIFKVIHFLHNEEIWNALLIIVHHLSFRFFMTLLAPSHSQWSLNWKINHMSLWPSLQIWSSSKKVLAKVLNIFFARWPNFSKSCVMQFSNRFCIANQQFCKIYTLSEFFVFVKSGWKYVPDSCPIWSIARKFKWTMNIVKNVGNNWITKPI